MARIPSKNRLQGLVVTTGKFPHRRSTQCCGLNCRAGESVIILPIREAGGALKRHVILHRRCVLALAESLPLDAQDYNSQFQRIRDRVVETGELFPAKKKRSRHG